MFLVFAANQDVITATSKKSKARKSNTRAAKRPSKARAVCKPCNAKANKRASGKRRKRAAKPPCHPPGYVDPAIAGNLRRAIRDMKRVGIRPHITSAWRSSNRQAELHRCSRSRRCRLAHPGLYYARPAGTSLHEAGFAVDIAGVAIGPRGRKRLTSRGRRIVAIMRRHGFSWRYGLADPAHFEIDPRTRGYRSARQAIHRSQTACDVKPVVKRRRAQLAGKTRKRSHQTT